MAAKLNRNIKALGWVSFLTDIHSEAILPLLPLFITQVLGLNRAFLGLVEGIADSTASLLKVASGWYSDRIRHRKTPTAAGYILSTVAKPFFAISATGSHVLGARFIDRVGKGIRTAPRDALIADSASVGHLGRAFGFHRMMDTLGAVVGTLLAYILLNTLSGTEGFRIRAVFLIATVFGIAAVITLIAFVREPSTPVHKAAAEQAEPKTRGGRVRLAFFFGINTIFYLGVFSYAFFLLRAGSLGIATGAIPLIYLYYNIIYALVSFPMGRLSDSIGRKPVILLAYISYSALCLGFAVASNVWHAWVLFGLYGFHSATLNPASRALVAGLSQTRSRATVLGIYHTSVGLAAFPASFAAGLLWDAYGARMPFLIAAVLAFVASLSMMAVPIDRNDAQPQ